MATLPSGMPEFVADDEDLTRFLTQSGHFNSFMAKPAAFLPNPKCRNTSVFRCGPEADVIRQIWQKTNTSDRQLKAAAVFKAVSVRETGLDVIAHEPADRHADIENWPWMGDDADIQKAKQLEKAQSLARNSKLVVV